MGTLNEDLTAIKAVEDKLTANQVAKFAYTQHAYDNPLTEADGVTAFNPENPQNIPLGRADILKVNPSVLQYGWRAQASAITRMLMNHFLGRVSYNLNKLNDNMSSLLTTVLSHLGTANGIATLDADGRIPYSQLPESAMELKGYWNADTNTPTLADGTGTSGDFYFVDVAGTRDLGSGEQYFAVGDRVLYDGVIWKNISSGNIKTINNRAPTATGNIDLTKSDVGLSNVDNTADSNMPVENGTTKFTTGGAHNMLTSLAPAFDATVSYSQGTIVSYQGRLYRCTTDHTGAWNDNDFAIANLNEGVGTSNVTGVKGEAESSYRSGNVNISMTDLIKNFKIIAGVPFLNYLGRKWKKINLLGRPVYINGYWFLNSTQDNDIYISEDAEHWVSVLTPDNVSAVIMYAKGVYIAFSFLGTPYWSEDGKTWSTGNVIGETPNFSNFPLVEAKTALYHKKLDIIEICTSNGIFYSEDGKTWQQGSFTNVSIPVDFAINSISASDDIIIAGDGSHSRVWWSEDGKVWTATQLASSNSFYVAPKGTYYADGEFCCCLTNQGVWHSTNGKSWSHYTNAGTPVLDTANVKLVYMPTIRRWVGLFTTSDSSSPCRFGIRNNGYSWSSIVPLAMSVNSTITRVGTIYDVHLIAPDIILITTNIGLFALTISPSASKETKDVLTTSSDSLQLYTNQNSANVPRVAMYLRSSFYTLFTDALNKNYEFISYDSLTVLFPTTIYSGNVSKELIVLREYGEKVERINFTDIDADITYFIHCYYGGGSLVLTYMTANDGVKLAVSNFNTIIDCIKEDSFNED